MSIALVKLQKVRRVLERTTRPPKTAHLPHDERVALHQVRVEATDAGVALADNLGAGGVLPSVVLAVMRRDKFNCAIHDDRCTGPMHVVSKHPVRFVWHHNNNPDHLITVCKAGTDAAQHQR